MRLTVTIKLLPRCYCLAAVALLCWSSLSIAQTPLHERIDQVIAAKPTFEQQAAAISSDAEFLRRIYLDLTGKIPTADEARAFLKDNAPNKRELLIDRLLASAEYARHMALVFDVALMDRRPDKHVPRGQWQEFLRAAFAANKPYDRLVREILSADGSVPAERPAAKFYLDRDGEPNLLTRDISRLFLGTNLQCAQCHDHPVVDQYKQDHYYGIFAFLNRSFVFQDKAKKLSVYAEKAEGEVSYQSVFDTSLTKTTGPRLPSGPLLKEPKLAKGDEYTIKPAKDVRPIPKFSRRAQLANVITGSDNAQFRRASANRLWAMMLGRGIVHPIDFDHAENPPSHPELLAALADEMAAVKFDLKVLLREVALSKTYQRSSELPAGVKEISERTFALALLRPLSSEQLAWSMMQATGLTDAERKTLGAQLTEATLYAKLATNVTPFVTTFAGPAGQTDDQGFQATLDQTLFLKNGALIRGWLTPRPGNLTDRLGKLKEADAIAEELYLSVLTRYPAAEERKEVAEYLAARTTDRPAALQDLVWALLTSAEFRFNH
jgi:hypothetical protein